MSRRAASCRHECLRRTAQLCWMRQCREPNSLKTRPAWQTIPVSSRDSAKQMLAVAMSLMLGCTFAHHMHITWSRNWPCSSVLHAKRELVVHSVPKPRRPALKLARDQNN